MNEHDIRYMQHALDLARKAIGLASPNPHVGCVIVNNGEVVGEGFHQYDWRDHAEIVALKSAGTKSRGATLYVNLEPCNHTGRTGPCSEAIISAGVSKVIAAMEDPFPKVAGAGFARLRAAGIEVEIGVLEREAQKINEGFVHFVKTGRPFITLKSALTLDGQLALPSSKKSSKRAWISSEESRAEVHSMRHASDALITGIGTILSDDPLLTDRSGLERRRKLLRVILDSKLRLPLHSRIVKTADEDLLVATAVSVKSAKARKLLDAGIEVLQLSGPQGKINWKAILKELGARQILSALLEAGPALNTSALQSKIVNRLKLFYAPKLAGSPTVPFVRSKISLPSLRDTELEQFGPDFAINALLV